MQAVVTGEAGRPPQPQAAAAVPLQWRCEPLAALGVSTLYALLQLRQQVFVVEQQCVYLDADGVDAQCHHLVALDGAGQVQAALRIVPPGVKYAEASIGRVVTSAAMRGTGVGHELVARGLQACARLHPGHGLRISAQAHLQRFYERHGFVAQGQTYLEDDIPHIEMWRAAPAG